MVNKNLGMLFLVKGVCGLKEIVGLIPDLVRMVEMPGNGKKKNLGSFLSLLVSIHHYWILFFLF